MTENFTIDQLDAVDVAQRNRDACVVAGPGSGKTTVLVEYFKRLVEAGVDPLRILAITFTEKAAGNMRKKLAQAFQHEPQTRARLERAWVSTVHGFCTRLLRENAVFAGVDPEFYVADERESWRMQQESMAAAMEELFAERAAEIRALIRGLSSMEFEEAVLNAYDAMRGAGITVEKLAAFPVPAGPGTREIAVTLKELRAESLFGWTPAQRAHAEDAKAAAQRVVDAATPLEALQAVKDFTCNLNKCRRGTPPAALLKQLREQIQQSKYGLITQFYARERQLLLEILRRFDAQYRERKRRAGALDFSDLEEFSVQLLEHNEAALGRVRRQFDHVLMDEFQDTNGQQARLLELVRTKGRFYAVGDINQSIFGFRHAEPEGFQSYRDQIQASGDHLVDLVANFRSRADILSAVETVAEDRSGIVDRPLLAGRKFDRERECCVELLSAVDLRSEAQWVARRILELCPAEFAFRDVAVLVRNTEVIGEFTAAFEEAGVPYLVTGGRGFYESREVNDLVHLLRVIANPRDEISLATVLRSPLVEASDEALVRLRVRNPAGLASALTDLKAEAAAEFGAEDYAKLSGFRDRLRRWRQRRESVTFDRLLWEAMDDCGYPSPKGSRIAANIDKLLAQARLAAPRMSLDAFVEELALVRASNPREPDAPPEDSADAVQVMTVHSAKGLEFPVVFVAAMQKGVDTKPPVVAFSRHVGLGARWRNPALREEKDDLYRHALRAEWKEREEKESDRLLYVAMTRAEEHLVLSYSGESPGNWAKVIIEKLHPEHPGLETRTAPDGKDWKLRVLLPEGAPEGARSVPAPVEMPDSAELLDLPAVPGQEDGNATVTALTRFAKCPRSYYLGQYLRFSARPRAWEEDDDKDDLPASELGTQVHALLAGTDVPDAGEDAVRLAAVFQNGPVGRRAAQADRVEREFDFLLAVEDLVIRGQVDLWFEQNGELCIVDYKTDNVTAAEAHERALDYALQLRLYALAVEQVAGRAPSRAWLHFLRPNTLVEVDLRPSLLDAPEQVVRDFQAAQSAVAFPLAEGPHCRRCEFYKKLCPAQ